MHRNTQPFHRAEVDRSRRGRSALASTGCTNVAICTQGLPPMDRQSRRGHDIFFLNLGEPLGNSLWLQSACKWSLGNVAGLQSHIHGRCWILSYHSMQTTAHDSSKHWRCICPRLCKWDPALGTMSIEEGRIYRNMINGTCTSSGVEEYRRGCSEASIEHSDQ
jgi:hypothetical protein